MDVRCERCRAQYVFDDAQITEAGLTVQCSNCGHLFKVKKKALVVTVPLKPGEAGDVPAITPSPSPALNAAASHAAPPPGAASEKKEWRVRQANGNVFTFKELTTLQKWIVERKVSRDDEISLSGDQWKRLGNIAELATFFQVVEAADRSQAQGSGPAITPLPVPLFPLGTAGQAIGSPPPPYAPHGGYPAAAPIPLTGGAAPVTSSIRLNGPTPSPSAAWESQTPSAPRTGAPEPAWTSEARVDLDDDLGKEELRAVRGGGGGKLLLLLLVLAAGGAAAVWFLRPDWVPEALRANPAAPATPPPVAQAPIPVEARPATPPAPVPAPPREELPAPVEKAPELVKEEPKPVKEAPKPVQEAPRPKGAKALLAEARKLRERGKTEKALDLFGRAVELDPESAEALAGRGWCYLDLSQYAPAEASFQAALDQQPDHADALVGLAETYRYEGRRADAVKFYERYLAIHPNGDDAVAARNAITQLKE
jgi:predicted Zn finger-like uncharacterized protein